MSFDSQGKVTIEIMANPKPLKLEKGTMKKEESTS